MDRGSSDYPKGCTLDGGAYVFLDSPAERGDGLWSGKQLGPSPRPVVIAFRWFDISEDLVDLLRREVPGIAPLLYIGSPDGYRRPTDEVHRAWDVAIVEAKPEGHHLGESGRLTAGEVVRLGLGLCDTIQSWASRFPITQGLRPETVYVTGDHGNRRYSGSTPRAALVLGYGPSYWAFPGETYDPPAANTTIDIALDDALFTVAMILWFALLGEHPYKLPDRPSIDDNIWEDRRRPFTGPPELGRLFDRVLVADIDKRMKTHEFKDELTRLARAWNVELPPFPPPGLAAP